MKFGNVLCVWFNRLLIVSTFLAFAGIYVSETQAKTVLAKPGENTQIGVIASYLTANCTSALTNPNVKASARNGRVTTRWFTHTFKDGHCKGRSIKVIVVWYQPNKGFQGRDTVTVNYFGPRGRRATESTMSGPVARKFNVKVE